MPAMRAGQPTHLQTDTPLSQASQLPQWTVPDLKLSNTNKNAPVFRSGHFLFTALYAAIDNFNLFIALFSS
ncbi:hypothetical protein FW800_19650 [Pseudomonas sp. 910_23]